LTPRAIDSTSFASIGWFLAGVGTPDGKFLYKIAPGGVYRVKFRTVNGQKQPGWCESLYHSKASELILYGRALGLSHAEAEDVVQETFVHLMQRPNEPEKPDHYCVRSFRNRALNYRRSLWRRLTREWESQRWFERAAEESPLEREAMAGLANLPTEQREAIVLKIWHDYTFEEIGELLELSPNTAAGRYRYGLQKLRISLKGVSNERDERIGDAVAFVGAAPPLGEA
jgi:RNA polymerase sigma-70 factor, ECF subfamily